MASKNEVRRGRYLCLRIGLAAVFFASVTVGFYSFVPMLALLVLLVITTFVFGRYFCAVLCPLGVLQDIIGIFRPKNSPQIPNLKYLRYGVAFWTFLFLAAGWTIGFRLFDPLSWFGTIVAGGVGLISTAALLFLIALASLVLWKKRIYCTAICPIGTVLGLCAKHGIYRLRMNENCVDCKICEKNCPTGCIDSQHRAIDNERCVRCMNCVSLCPKGAISLSCADMRASTPVDSSRRAFLAKSAGAAVGMFVAGHFLGGPVRKFATAMTLSSADNLILPPGAVEDFSLKCTSCQFCAISCPAQIIKSRFLGTVHLDYTKSGCLFDCAKCASVCPSGALRPISLEDKQWLKIGEAEFFSEKCRVTREGTACDLCFKACPKGAIFMKDSANGLKIPEIAAFHCIGCGACQAACPMQEKAIKVNGVEQMT